MISLQGEMFQFAQLLLGLFIKFYDILFVLSVLQEIEKTSKSTNTWTNGVLYGMEKIIEKFSPAKRF